jgi:gliding motility-associated-like protein
VDNTLPVFTVVPSPITVFADGSCLGTASWTIPTATDNCGTVTITQTAGLASGSTNFPIGVTTITYTADDGHGNTTPYSFTVTVEDHIAPVFTVVPSPIIVSADGSCQGTASWTAPTATDNCGTVTVTQTAGLASGSTNFPLGVTTITYTADDGHGNSTPYSFTVTVEDHIAPVFTVVPSPIIVSADGSCQGTASWTAPTATDNCGNATVTQTAGLASGSTNFPLGSTTIIYTADDGHGNTTPYSFTVTVEDHIAPVFTVVPSPIIVSADGSCQGTASWTAPTASDNCGTVTITQTAGLASGSTDFPLGTTTITYTADDGHGNTTPYSFTVTVEDHIAPAFTVVPSPIIASADGSCQGTASWTAPTATDNCGTVIVTQTAGPASGSTNFPLGATTITYTADDGHGNTTPYSFTVTVEDHIAPVITTCPSDISVNLPVSGCSIVVTWNVPSATDNCTLVSFTSNYNSGDSFPLGTTIVTYTATDNSGNISTCSFNIVVNDITAPVITGCPADITVSLPSSGCSTLVNWTAPTVTDNCTIASFTSNYVPGDIFPLGTSTVTYTAIDISGNISICSFNVSVNDTSNPVFTNCPADITISANASCEAVVSWTIPTVTDNCMIKNFVGDHYPGEMFPLGTTTITYTATDNSGNTSTCSFSITVNDTSNPVITNCPNNITVSANSSCQAIVSWNEPVATDNCTIASFVTDHAPGSVFAAGTTTVTYTATDQKGNTSTCSFTVLVKNGGNPEITGCYEADAIVAHADESGTAEVTWTEPVATVLCGNVSVKKSHEPGSRFSIGINMIVYTFTDDFGNSSVCTFNVSILESSEMFAVSKAVTPNGDGINDLLTITNIDNYPDNSVVVVDRWGNQIYSATGYNNEHVAWNATNGNGNRVPTGTYFYKVEIRAQGQLFKKTGFIEVIQ